MILPTQMRAVVFDAVGTLLHPAPSAPVVYEMAVKRCGWPHEGLLDRLRASYLAEEAIDQANGWRTTEAREILRWQRIVAATVPESGDALFQELYYHFAQPDAWRVTPDAAATIEELSSRNYKLLLASNYDSRLDQVLDGKPELAPLRPALISAAIGWRKPGQAFFDRVAGRLALAVHEIAYVGDDYGNDFVGASEAGMHAILHDPLNRRPEVAPRVTTLRELLDA